MAGLVTLAVAKAHLKITDTDHDADVQRYADQASLAIVGWLDAQADPAWDETTVPLDVQAAILVMLQNFYDHGELQGPTARTGKSKDEETWDAVERLLMRRRAPSLG